MSSSHRLTRSLAVASSAILLVASGAFAHDKTVADAPAGGASSPATWQEDDDRQATDFLDDQQGNEDEQGDDAQGNEDDQDVADEAARHREQSGQEHHAVAVKPAKTASDSTDENDDDQGEDADENEDGEHDDADDHDGGDGDQGEHDDGDQDEHDGGDD